MFNMLAGDVTTTSAAGSVEPWPRAATTDRICSSTITRPTETSNMRRRAGQSSVPCRLVTNDGINRQQSEMLLLELGLFVLLHSYAVDSTILNDRLFICRCSCTESSKKTAVLRLMVFFPVRTIFLWPVKNLHGWLDGIRITRSRTDQLIFKSVPV